VRELGRGGVGVVWLADDQLVRRRVAVKELRPPQGLSDADREVYATRALQEARSAARIHHPNAVTLHDVLPATAGDDAVYLIMELIEGPTLAQLIAQDGALPAPRVARYGLQLLNVLEAAHTLGIVHRDVKPGNIMITADDQVKLADFGFAHTMGDPRLTRSGVMGTQAYMAPELFESEPITPAVDMWSLGATLYCAAEGRGPFDRDSTGATLRAILIDKISVPRCAPLLAAAITGLLRREPDQRATIEKTRAGLLQAASQTSGPQPPPPVAPEPPAGPASNPAWFDQDTGRREVLIPAPHPVPEQPAGGRPPYRRAIVIGALIVAVGLTGGFFGAIHSRSPGTHKLTVTSRKCRSPLVQSIQGPQSTSGTRPIIVKPRPKIAIAGKDLAGNSALSPDGKMVATYDPSSVALWNAANGQRYATLPGGGAFSVAFSPHTQLLAVADGSLSLWGITNHNRRPIARTRNIGACGVAFSPLGGTLAVADFKGVQLWTVRPFRFVTTLGGLSRYAPGAVAFSPNGKTLAAVDSATNQVVVWSIGKLKPIEILKPPTNEASGQDWIAFSRGGRALAIVADSIPGAADVWVWDVARHKLDSTLVDPYGRGVTAVAFSPDGHTLAVAYLNGAIYLWNVVTHKDIAILHDSSVSQTLSFSLDGRLLATNDRSGHVYIWNVPEVAKHTRPKVAKHARPRVVKRSRTSRPVRPVGLPKPTQSSKP
jgi:serine/threonine protein kinase